MMPNMASWDRIVRMIVGIALVLLGLFVLVSGVRWLLLVVGAVLVGTSLAGYCPLYALLGITTHRR
ncbi:MAG: DUF2892 domain-containing protein [Chloroflexi bacterium]|jgi:uncharacterized membrane protein|nr:DUF2892 domain-containing protein [Chloroflexota bacterium]